MQARPLRVHAVHQHLQVRAQVLFQNIGADLALGGQAGPDMGGADFTGDMGGDPNVVDADYQVVDDDNQ